MAGNTLSLVVSWPLRPGAFLEYVRTRMHLLMRMYCQLLLLAVQPALEAEAGALGAPYAGSQLTQCHFLPAKGCSRQGCSVLTHDSVTRAGTVSWKARAGHAK